MRGTFNLKLVHKINLLVFIGLAAGLGTSFYLISRMGLVGSSYQKLLAEEVRQRADAKGIQLKFKKQVQEWKDILLRGYDSAALTKYTDQFHQREAEVQQDALTLRAAVGNAAAKDKLDQFIQAHQLLSANYSQALDSFKKSKGQDFKAADAAVKGQDRAPTDLIDTVVADITKQADDKEAALRAQVAKDQSSLLILSSLLSVGIITISVLVSRALGRQMSDTVRILNEITTGEIDLTRRLEVKSKDEIGELCQWFNLFAEKIHNTVAQVASGTHRLASASEEISAAATQQAEGADTQKDRTGMVATALQEMSSTVLQVTENSNRAAEASRKAAETARQGGKVVDETLVKMRLIAETVGTTAKKVQELGKSSDSIGEIISVIDDIADQTNLLALNAAIEAARAGEQGRGFAVVADEVRKLAERTSKATREITGMIKSIQVETRGAVEAMQSGTRQVEEGVQTTAGAGRSLAEIIRMAEQVGEMITHIATASAQQSSASEEINNNVESIAKVTLESAAGAQQSAKSCHELSSLALDLQNLVGQFRVDAGSKQEVAVN